VCLSERIKHQQYILFCGQQIEGGLRDKPGKSRDHYHSSYVLSGLSLAQHAAPSLILGDPANRLQPTHPAYNICPQKVEMIKTYFATQRM
jgi:protein farnesyltransferase subunit beta